MVTVRRAEQKVDQLFTAQSTEDRSGRTCNFKEQALGRLEKLWPGRAYLASRICFDLDKYTNYLSSPDAAVLYVATVI